MTVEELSKILYEEFALDNWGDIDPYLFREVYDYTDEAKDSDEDVAALKQVLLRVISRLSLKELSNV